MSIDRRLGIGIMLFLPLNMTKQEQHNEWHNQLKALCHNLVNYHNAKLAQFSKGELGENRASELMNDFRNHFAKVSLKQGTDMDSILGYEDMLDYAKWYVSGESII
jgi:hypothetical protein